MWNSNETKEDYTAHKYPGLVFKIVVLFSGLTLFAQPQSLLAAADPNESCMACHEDQNLKDSNGRILFVNNRDFKQSIHGRLGITCVNCHRDLENITDFPHAERSQLKGAPAQSTPDLRELSFHACQRKKGWRIRQRFLAKCPCNGPEQGRAFQQRYLCDLPWRTWDQEDSRSGSLGFQTPCSHDLRPLPCRHSQGLS
jgi:hypothetical protein